MESLCGGAAEQTVEATEAALSADAETGAHATECKSPASSTDATPETIEARDAAMAVAFETVRTAIGERAMLFEDDADMPMKA